jgi:large subunit ribosomal protein L10
MAKTKSQKTTEIEQLRELLSAAKGIYLTDFTHMTVDSITSLRRQCRDADVTYRVVKNSLMERAFGEVGISGVESHFDGPTALAVSSVDELAPARVIIDFRKKHELPQVKVGIVEGNVFDAAQVEKLAGLPPKPVLVSRFMAAAQGPVRGLAVVLQATVRQLVYALNAVAEKQKEQDS